MAEIFATGGAPLLNPASGGIKLPQETLERLVASILGAVEAEEIYVFGSYARGEQTPDSDVDVFIVSEDDSPRAVALVGMELRWLKMHVDIVMERRALFDLGKTRFGLVEREVGMEGVKIYG